MKDCFNHSYLCTLSHVPTLSPIRPRNVPAAFFVAFTRRIPFFCICPRCPQHLAGNSGVASPTQPKHGRKKAARQLARGGLGCPQFCGDVQGNVSEKYPARCQRSGSTGRQCHHVASLAAIQVISPPLHQAGAVVQVGRPVVSGPDLVALCVG